MTDLRISATRPARAALIEYEARVMADANRRCQAADTAIAFRERNAPGIAPIEPAALIALFPIDPEAAYLALSDLTESQFVNQAIETAVYLGGMGKNIPWQMLLERWESRIEMLFVAMARAA